MLWVPSPKKVHLVGPGRRAFSGGSLPVEHHPQRDKIDAHLDIYLKEPEGVVLPVDLRTPR